VELFYRHSPRSLRGLLLNKAQKQFLPSELLSVFTGALPELAESGNSLISKVHIYFSVPTNFVHESLISPVPFKCSD
jgi:hypothetical protein